MPTLTYDKNDLKKLIGKKIADEQLEEVINLIKPSVEKLTENEIVVEDTPDRPDLFGIEGLARAVQDYLNIKPGLQKYPLTKPKLSIKIESVPVRPFVAAAVIRNVKLTDELIKSLMNIQEVLHETIGRKRKKVAIGIHDLDKIKLPISYVATTRDAKIIPLESKEEIKLKEVLEKVSKGREYGNIISSAKFWPVFTDAHGIFSFPPIINSNRTRLTPETRNLLIELTGADKKSVLQTLNIIVTNLGERNYSIEPVRLKYEKKTELTPDLNESVIEVDQNEVNKLLGVKLNGKQMISLLRRMGYDAVETGDRKLEVIIPAYRVDILHPVDVIEDIGIAYGFNDFIPELPSVATIGKSLPLEKLCSKVRQLLIGLGLQETMNFVLSNSKEQFDKMNMSRKNDVIEIENPVSEEYTCLRKRVKPSLLKVLSKNKHVEYPQNIFEIGDAVLKDEKEETRSKTIRKVAIAICYSRASFAEIKFVVDYLFKNLDVEYKLEKFDFEEMVPGRSARILINGKYSGSFGEIHPQVLENWEIGMPVAALEINLENL